MNFYEVFSVFMQKKEEYQKFAKDCTHIEKCVPFITELMRLEEQLKNLVKHEQANLLTKAFCDYVKCGEENIKSGKFYDKFLKANQNLINVWENSFH